MTKKPPTFESAAFLVFARNGYYCLAKDGFSSDSRLIGVCNECVKDLNEFKQKYKKPVDVNHPNLVHTFI